MNGTNLSFTLPSTPNPGTSVKIYKNGILLMPNLDYTLSGASHYVFKLGRCTSCRGFVTKLLPNHEPLR